jgi:predicted RNA-binding Zn ribbon-like protein
VTQLDQMTQQNAALVEQSTAAAQALREQADRLAQAVAVFRVSRTETREAIAQAQATSRAAVTTPVRVPRRTQPAAVPTQPHMTSAPRPTPPAPQGRDDWKEF